MPRLAYTACPLCVLTRAVRLHLHVPPQKNGFYSNYCLFKLLLIHRQECIRARQLLVGPHHPCSGWTCQRLVRTLTPEQNIFTALINWQKAHTHITQPLWEREREREKNTCLNASRTIQLLLQQLLVLEFDASADFICGGMCWHVPIAMTHTDGKDTLPTTTTYPKQSSTQIPRMQPYVHCIV